MPSNVLENTGKTSSSRSWPGGNCGGAPLRVLACVETEAGAPLSALWPLPDNGYFTPATGGWVWLPSPAAVVRALRPSRSFCGLSSLSVRPSVLTLLPGWEWRGRACDWAGLFLGRAALISCRGPLTWDKCLQGTKGSALQKSLFKSISVRSEHSGFLSLACFIDQCGGYLKTNQDFSQVQNLRGWQAEQGTAERAENQRRCVLRLCLGAELGGRWAPGRPGCIAADTAPWAVTSGLPISVHAHHEGNQSELAVASPCRLLHGTGGGQ